MPTIAEILLFKYPNEMSSGLIRVQDDGQGQYIKVWNMGSIPKPTDAQIQAYLTDADYLSNKATYNRMNAPDGYGPISDQLDMIYKDLKDGTQYWQQRIGYVKDVLYPKTGVPTTPPDVTPILTAKRNAPSSAFKEITMAKSSGIQTISGTNKIDVVFGTKMSDPNNVFNSNAYTALTGGLYEVIVFAQVTNYAILTLVANYSWNLYITQTGTTPGSSLIGSHTHGVLAALPASIQGTHMLYMAAGDKFTVQVSKTDATALNVTFAYLDIKKICEA